MFHSWHILDSRNLLAFEVIDEVAEFLLLICQYVYACFTQTDRDMGGIPIQDLLGWFRHHPDAKVPTPPFPAAHLLAKCCPS